MKASDVDRVFIQALMTRRVVSEELAKMLWKKSKEAVQKVDADVDGVDNIDWSSFLERVKKSLDVVDLTIAKITDEENGTPILALINTNDDEIAQLATEYTAIEITFFKQIIEQIVTAPGEAYSISSMAALQERKNLGAKLDMSGMQAQAVLNSLVSRGWLVKSRRSRYSLAPRALLELRKYLTQTFEGYELSVCHRCDGLVFKGYRCMGEDGKCLERVHKPCFEAIDRANKGRCNCPTCGGRWRDEDAFRVVGEDVVREGAVEPKRRNLRGDDDDDDEGEQEEVDMDGEEGPSQNKRKPKKEKKPKKEGKKSSRKKAREEEEEAEEEEEEEAVESQDEEQPEADQPMEEDEEEEAPPKRRSSRR